MDIIKTTCLFFFGMMLAVNCHAQQVTQREAVQAAINTIRYEKNGDANRMVDTVFTKTRKGDTLMYEVVFDDGNIVLLSGNKACIPVLGIILLEATDTNSISSVIDTNNIFAGGDNVPDGLGYFLDEYEQQIAYCFRNNITGYYSRLWQQLQTYDSNLLRNNVEVSPLLTTEWGQKESNDKGYYQPDYCAYNELVTKTNCFNHICPKCPAGCVAVAMGQIMKYWDHPAENPCENLLFDWNNMPDALILHNNSNYYVEERAVATLLRDCGKRTNMDYCSIRQLTCTSTAIPDTACKALKGYGYTDAVFLQRSNYPNWISLMIADLDNGYPIFYSGYPKDEEVGHAFVCDGYKERPILGGYKFHFNWGWNGRKDSWFVLDKLTPGNSDFSYYHTAIFNLYPTGCFSNIIRVCDTVFLGGTIKSFAASENIRNDGYMYVISSNASIYLQAGEEILLTNGFYAVSGSDFQAIIAPCSSAATSFPDHLSSGTADDNPADTLPAPKSLQTEVSPADDAGVFDTPLRVWPNPTDDLLFVELRGAEIATVALYDLQGRIVTGVCDTPLQMATATLNMKSVPAGVYVLRVTDAEGQEHQGKIVRR